MDADSPPAKRRRTSPRLSNRGSTEPANTVGATETTTANITTTTTTTTPPDAPAADTETDDTRPRPPSFASPTRASLARHNPAILDRRQSAPKNGNNSTEGEEGEEVQPSVEEMIDEQLSQTSAEKDKGAEKDVRPLARPPMRSPVRSPSRQLSPTRPLARPALRSPVRLSRSRSRSPTRRLFGSTGNGNGNEDSGSALFGTAPQKSPEAARNRQMEGLAGSAIGSSIPGSLLGEPPRRSPMKPVPRPLPPPDPQRGQDLLEPLIARDKQRSALERFRTQDDAEQPPPEPELPPTPDNVDHSALARSPPGIHHSSTPSKRPKRAARARAAATPAGGVQKVKPGTVQSSSPLKQPPMKATASTEEGETPAIGNADALRESSGNVPSSTTRGRGRPRKSEPARNIQPPDPDGRKKRQRDTLQAEIDALEADLALAAAENERIRTHGVEGGNNQAAIISLLRRRVLPESEGDDDDQTSSTSTSMKSTLDWLQAATNPIAFLPFGKPRADVTELFQFAAPAGSGDDASTTADDNLPPPVSHHPIEMTADEELPFLQAFTPLAFRSEIVVLPASEAGEALLQKHIIFATSTTPAGLFLARIEMTVNSKNLRITDLQVPRIEPPAAAAELKPLLDRVTQPDTDNSDNGSSALTRNVTVLMWAMGEWVRVAVRRAKFWAVLAKKLREKEDMGDEEEGIGGIAGMVDDIRRLRSQQRKRRRRKGDDDEDEDNTDNDKPAPVSQLELFEHLGRNAMDVDVDARASTSLRVEWSIQFDWTGEAKSQIGLLVGVPGKWRKADKRGRLARLPKLFDQLVQDSGDPMEAVQTVVALLVGGQ